jgi:hypothetical protein
MSVSCPSMGHGWGTRGTRGAREELFWDLRTARGFGLRPGRRPGHFWISGVMAADVLEVWLPVSPSRQPGVLPTAAGRPGGEPDGSVRESSGTRLSGRPSPSGYGHLVTIRAPVLEWRSVPGAAGIPTSSARSSSAPQATTGLDWSSQGEACVAVVLVSLGGNQLHPLYDKTCSLVHLVQSLSPVVARGTRLLWLPVTTCGPLGADVRGICTPLDAKAALAKPSIWLDLPCVIRGSRAAHKR